MSGRLASRPSLCKRSSDYRKVLFTKQGSMGHHPQKRDKFPAEVEIDCCPLIPALRGRAVVGMGCQSLSDI